MDITTTKVTVSRFCRPILNNANALPAEPSLCGLFAPLKEIKWKMLGLSKISLGTSAPRCAMRHRPVIEIEDYGTR